MSVEESNTLLGSISEILPHVSVIIPCRNEANFIAECVESVVANDYPHNCLEVLVIDGMSDDGTWPIVCELARRSTVVKPMRNEKRSAAAALNLGIRNAGGEIICRVDAHAMIAPDYLRRCVVALRESNADNVGGAMETLPSRQAPIAKAIAAVMSHPFGVGNSKFRTRTTKPVFTDTVFGGCYRRALFDHIGLFNENLLRTQDMEFNQRLRCAGGTIFLDPAIKSYYYACPGLKPFCRHNFQDGIWSVLPFAHCDGFPVRWRHLVAAVFLGFIICGALCGIWSYFARIALAVVLCFYFVASIASSIHSTRCWRDYRAALVMPIVFAARHFAYGFGSLWGLARVIAHRSLLRNPSQEMADNLKTIDFESRDSS